MSVIPSTLADSEQLIANLHRQLAECKAERDEALQRETATAEVLQVINSSPGDLAPVFDAMLDKALGLCGRHLASFGPTTGHTFMPKPIAASRQPMPRFCRVAVIPRMRPDSPGAFSTASASPTAMSPPVRATA